MLAATAAARIPGRRGRRRAFPVRWYLAKERLILGIAGFVLTLGLWDLLGRLRLVNPVLLSSPGALLAASIRLYRSPGLLENLAVSGREFFLGYSLAVALGLAVGLSAGWYRTVRDLLEPYIMCLYSIPKTALLPLFLIWFGIGLESKIAMVFLWAVFPIVINTMAGVRAMEQQFIRLARSFGANDAYLFRSVILPGTVPYILTGLRLSVARGLVGLVTAELYGANAGIGFLITVAGVQIKIPDMLAGVAIVAAFGVAGTQLLYRVERSFDRWRPALGA